MFDGKSRDFGNENSAECIGDGSVQADEGEGGIIWVGRGVNLDFEVLETRSAQEVGVVVTKYLTSLKRSKFQEWSSPG